MFKCISVSTSLFHTFGVLHAWARKTICANLNLISKTERKIIPILFVAEMQVAQTMLGAVRCLNATSQKTENY